MVGNEAYLVINLLVQVFDEDIALAGLAKSGITLRPHDTAVVDQVMIDAGKQTFDVCQLRSLGRYQWEKTHQARFLMRE